MHLNADCNKPKVSIAFDTATLQTLERAAKKKDPAFSPVCTAIQKEKVKTFRNLLYWHSNESGEADSVELCTRQQPKPACSILRLDPASALCNRNDDLMQPFLQFIGYFDYVLEKNLQSSNSLGFIKLCSFRVIFILYCSAGSLSVWACSSRNWTAEQFPFPSPSSCFLCLSTHGTHSLAFQLVSAEVRWGGVIRPPVCGAAHTKENALDIVSTLQLEGQVPSIWCWDKTGSFQIRRGPSSQIHITAVTTSAQHVFINACSRLQKHNWADSA